MSRNFHFFTNPRILTWTALWFSVVICISITWIHFRQQMTFGKTIDSLQNMRQARIDMTKGFLYVSAAHEESSPFDPNFGLALLRQAMSTFDGFAESAYPDYSAAAQEFQGVQERFRVFHDLIMEWIETKTKRPDLETLLRINFHDLERQADQIDRRLEADLEKLTSNQDRWFVLSVSGASLLLVGLCGIIFWAERMQEKTTAALRESEERWQFALEGAGDGVWDWNIEENRTYFSRQWKTMLGFEEHEIKNQSEEWNQRVHPSDRDCIYEKINKQLEGTSSIYEGEYRLRCKNGDYKWILARGKVITRTAEGKPLRMIGTHTDITQLKQTEKHILKLNRLYAILSEINQAIVRIRDSQNLFQTICQIAVNQGGFRLVWIGLVDDSPRSIHPVAYAGEPGDYLKDIQSHIDKIEQSDCPIYQVLEDGKHRICNSIERADRMISCQKDALDLGYRAMASFPLRVFETIRGTINFYASEPDCFDRDELRLLDELAMDISYSMEFTEQDIERKRAEINLRASEERYRGLVELSPEAVFVNRNDQVVFINAAAVKLFGADTPDQLMGISPFDLFDPEFHPIMRGRIEALLQGVSVPLIEGKIVKRNGEIVDVEVVASSFDDAEGTAIQVILRDIQNRKRAEEEKEYLRSQLTQAQKMEAVGRLAGGVAHDFNNIIMAIQGYSEIVLNDLPPGTESRNDMEEIITAADRAASLTRQLLAFARKQTVSPKVLDLNESVTSMLKMLQRLIGEDINLAWLPGHNLWKVNIDPSQIDQILANLMVNARDAIVGVGKVTLETSNTEFNVAYCDEHSEYVPGEYVCLAVSDDGCGMEKETINNIFEPFFTTKGLGKGTGLGLSTVYGIVRQNEGFINVYSEPKLGTTFRIYIPRFMVENPEVPRENEIKILPKGTETILLVEDDTMILTISKRIISGLGYTVLAANRPDEALQLATDYSGDIHLLITDVVMPEMNGRELAGRIARIKPDIKCLFMSGYTADVIAHRGVLEEGVNFIQKPYSTPDLAAKIYAILGKE